MTQKEIEEREWLKSQLIKVLLGVSFAQVDDQLVNVSLLERNLRTGSND